MRASLVLAAAAVAAAQTDTFKLIMLPNSAASNAVCLDGTPYGIYWQAGSGSGANNWMVYFQGGGWCVRGRARFPDGGTTRTQSS